MATTSTPQPGTIIGKDYRLEKLLQQGGMGSVFIATQLSTGKKRALKLMKPELAVEPKKRERFELEAKVVARIQSAHIVDVIGAGVDEADGIPWLAMELLEGEDLAYSLKRRGPLPREDVAEIFAQLCEALSAAHAAGVVHRDLKPENIFLENAPKSAKGFTVKVLDFGISKLVAHGSAAMTAAIGTPHWMAPEQTVDNSGVTPLADIWPLGLMAFRVLTGRFYWLAANKKPVSLIAILKEVAIAPLVPPSERATELGCGERIPAGFDAWFDRCVNRDASKRFQDAVDAAKALELVLSGRKPPIEHTEKMPRLPDAVLDAPKAPKDVPASAATQADLPVPTRRRPWLTYGAIAAGGGALAAVLALSARAPTQETTKPRSSTSQTAITSSPPASGASAPVNAASQPERYNVPIGVSPSRGPADALVTIVEFANFQCPFSRSAQPSIRKLLADYPKDVRLVWKDDPLAIHPRAEAATTVAREAHAVKGAASFWTAHDALFKQPVELGDPHLGAVGKELGLDPASVDAAIEKRSYGVAIDDDIELGDGLNVATTPTLFINGRKVAGVQPYEALKKIVDEEIVTAAALVASGTPAAQVYETLVARGKPPQLPERRQVAAPHLKSPVRGGGAEQLVTVQQFCDFESAVCAATAAVMSHLLERYGGKVAVVWRDAPQPGHGKARLAAMAAREAFEQKGAEGFAKMHDLLLSRAGAPGAPTRQEMEDFAAKSGLDMVAFKLALDSEEHAGAIDYDVKAAADADIQTVPTFVVGEYVLRGLTPLKSITKRIDAAMAEASKP